MPTHYIGSQKTTAALNTFIYFTRAANSLEARLYSHDLLQGLTQSQFGVLETLFHLGSLTPGELSQKLLRSTGNMTLVLDNLEKQDYILREREKRDRRSIKVILTQKGKDLIESVLPEVINCIEEEFAIFSDDEQSELGRLCKILGKKKRE